MSQYNNGNAINHISVIPDYMDNKVEESDEGLYIKLTKEDNGEIGEESCLERTVEEEEEGEVEVNNDDEKEEVELLDSNDEDEKSIDNKLYILSINGIPYYYQDTLKEAREQMVCLANHLVGTLNNTNGPGHIYVTDNNMKKIKVIAPYNFLMLTYNYVIHEISLEYAIKLL
jgi:hypothetical protein